MLVTTLGCQTPKPKPQGNAAPIVKLKAITQVTDTAENRRPLYTGNPNQVLLLSAARTQHAHAQVYSLNPNTKQVKRWTHQNGEIHDLEWTETDGRVYYSSSTDEEKENPSFLREALRKYGAGHQEFPKFSLINGEYLPPTEIYRSDSLGENIERLTKSPNFDGEFSINPKQNEILFTSFRSGIAQIYAMTKTGENLRLWSVPKQASARPVISNDGKSVAYIKLVDPDHHEIWLTDRARKTEKLLVPGTAAIAEMTWRPDGSELIFSSNRNANFDLFVIKTDGTCLRQITNDDGHERDPAISKDGTDLMFSNNQSGQWQIYSVKYDLPACAESLPTVL